MDLPWVSTRAAILCGTGVACLIGLHGSRLLTWNGDQTLHSILESMAMMLGLMAGALALVRSYTTNEVNTAVSRHRFRRCVVTRRPPLCS